MKTFEVAITMTDVTSVDAETAEEAYDIARDIFADAGYYNIHSNAELDIIGVSEYDGDADG